MVSRWLFDLYRPRPLGGQGSGSSSDDAVLDAAEKLIKLNGAAAVTMLDIAKEAGRSVNAVSTQFVNTAAMAQAVYERFAERARLTTLAIVDPTRWAGASLGEIIDAYVRYLMLISRDRHALQRAMTELLSINPAVKVATTSMRAELEGGMYALILARGDEVTHDEPDVAARFVIDQIGVMVRAWVAPNSDEEFRRLARLEEELGDDRYQAELVRSACAYLGVDPPGAGSGAGEAPAAT